MNISERFIWTLMLLVTYVGVFVIGGSVGRWTVTPPSVPVIQGQHCWQEYNKQMPKRHELICMKDEP